MYYIKINGKIIPQKFNLIREARAEIERLKQEAEVSSWNILTEESAALEKKSLVSKWHISGVEKICISVLLILIAGAALFLWQRQRIARQPTHYVIHEQINYRDKQGNILGQLPKGTKVVCHKIVDQRCQIIHKGKKAYIYLNVLETIKP